MPKRKPSYPSPIAYAIEALTAFGDRRAGEDQTYYVLQESLHLIRLQMANFRSDRPRMQFLIADELTDPDSDVPASMYGSQKGIGIIATGILFGNRCLERAADQLLTLLVRSPDGDKGNSLIDLDAPSIPLTPKALVAELRKLDPQSPGGKKLASHPFVFSGEIDQYLTNNTVAALTKIRQARELTPEEAMQRDELLIRASEISATDGKIKKLLTASLAPGQKFRAG